jgi:hypothetical protein
MLMLLLSAKRRLLRNQKENMQACFLSAYAASADWLILQHDTGIELVHLEMNGLK